MSDMDIYSRDPLQSWGSFSLWMFPTFSEEFSKWSANFLKRFLAIWRLCSARSLRGYLLLPPGFQLNYRSSGGAYLWGISLVPKFSLILGGSPTFSEGLFCFREHVPGSLNPAFSSRRILTKKVSMGRLPYL